MSALTSTLTSVPLQVTVSVVPAGKPSPVVIGFRQSVEPAAAADEVLSDESGRLDVLTLICTLSANDKQLRYFCAHKRTTPLVDKPIMRDRCHIFRQMLPKPLPLKVISTQQGVF